MNIHPTAIVEEGAQIAENVYRGEKIGIAAGECRVSGQVVSSAELMFSVVKIP
jgi:acyl-[acyl carrier protein]--UDP-N-acetylglucosamine O-acyltransferase